MAGRVRSGVGGVGVGGVGAATDDAPASPTALDIPNAVSDSDAGLRRRRMMTVGCRRRISTPVRAFCPAPFEGDGVIAGERGWKVGVCGCGVRVSVGRCPEFIVGGKSFWGLEASGSDAGRPG
jgi:hypothetical protein